MYWAVKTRRTAVTRMPRQGLHSLGFSANFIYISLGLVPVGTFQHHFHPVLFDVMASDDLDIPQIAVVGVPEDNNHASSADSLPSPSSDVPHLPPSPLGHATSQTDNQAFLSLPTPILKSARNSLDPIGSPSSHTSDTSSLQPPPSPTLSAHSAGSGSIRFASSTVLRENNPEEHDGMTSLKLLAPPPPHHRRKGSVATVSSVGSSSTEREYEDNQSFRLSPVRSAHSDATSTLPSPTHTHVDVVPEDHSRSSSPASFLRKTLHRVRRSPSPSGETDTGSETTRNDGQKGENSDVKRKGPELARPAVLDLKQEADMDVHPFGFKPLQLASLVDPKSLETLENLGGVDAILRGLGTQPTHGLSTKLALPPTLVGSHDPTSQDFSESHTADKSPPKPNIMVTSPAGVPQGLQSTASLAGGSGVSLPTPFQSSEDVYKTSIEDRKRIFGQNFIPQRPSKTLLQLMWLALKDKVLVRRICTTYSNV